MNAIVIEHVKVTELPEAWQSKLAEIPGATVTVRIEAESQEAVQTEQFSADDPLFGMWRDREDVANVENYLRAIHAARFRSDGTQR